MRNNISGKVKRLKKPQQAVWNTERRTKWNDLVSKLAGAGLQVRREELKRGHGWRALSGVCRSLNSRFVFVDSRLAPDDQIGFLVSRVGELS